jgi:Tfp pilus assembly protein PilP
LALSFLDYKATCAYEKDFCVRAYKTTLIIVAGLAALLMANEFVVAAALSGFQSNDKLTGAYVELSAKNVEGNGLLHVIALHNGIDFVAAPGDLARIDFPSKALEIDAIWRDAISRLRMKQIDRNGFRLVVPECRSLVAASSVEDYPAGEKVTISFSAIPAERLYKLMAEIMGLELRIPDGLPDAKLAIVSTNRSARYALQAVNGALAMQTKISGGLLIVSKPKINRGCDEVDAQHWRSDVKLEPNVIEWLGRQDMAVRSACPRAVNSSNPKIADCAPLESVPLGRMMLRGYMRLSPKSALGALIEAPNDPFLYWANPGDLVGNNDEKLINVGSRHMEIVEIKAGEKTGRSRRKELNRGFVTESHASTEVTNMAKREFLESYDMRDLMLTSTELIDGQWRATITDPNGKQHALVLGRYLGGDLGRVTNIDQGVLTLIEIRSDALGGYVEHPITLRKNVPYVEPRDVIRNKYTAPIVPTSLQRILIAGATKGDTALVEQTLLDGASIDAAYTAWGDSPLLAAVRGNQASVVELLIRKGARLDLFSGVSELTPLNVAASENHPLLVARLLKAGADPSITDVREHLPIHYAASEGDAASVKLLIDAKSRLNAWTNIGLTPFANAALGGHTAIIQMFLANGIKVNDVDRNGNTMLHAAVWGNNLECARKLIELGADVNRMNAEGERPLDDAQKKERVAMIDLLTSKGAKTSSPK